MGTREIDKPAIPYGFWPSLGCAAVTLAVFAAMLMCF